jgi:hypothetical protein
MTNVHIIYSYSFLWFIFIQILPQNGKQNPCNIMKSYVIALTWQCIFICFAFFVTWLTEILELKIFTLNPFTVFDSISFVGKLFQVSTRETVFSNISSTMLLVDFMLVASGGVLIFRKDFIAITYCPYHDIMSLLLMFTL